MKANLLTWFVLGAGVSLAAMFSPFAGALVVAVALAHDAFQSLQFLKSEDANEKVRRQIEALERVVGQLQEERAAEAHKRALGF